MEALRKAHQEEIERLKGHGGGEPTDPSVKEQLYVHICSLLTSYHSITCAQPTQFHKETSPKLLLAHFCVA